MQNGYRSSIIQVRNFLCALCKEILQKKRNKINFINNATYIWSHTGDDRRHKSERNIRNERVISSCNTRISEK